MIEKNLKTVALIGRPNVGKSTLFNRLVGKRIAIETPIPGTTRDRLYGEVSWRGETFNLIDVAGVEIGSKKEIDKDIQKGIDAAMENAELILFLVDWHERDNEMDKIIARKLRPLSKKVILVINKADDAKKEGNIDEFKRLGGFSVVPVSAISGQSSGDLLDEVVKFLKKIKISAVAKSHKKSDINLSIIGRPNVGKSTLMNVIIGEKRAIVSEEAGTTRDTIQVEFMHKGKNIVIADTAGIRRPGKVKKDTIESFSVLRSYRALKNCDIAILVIDASEGLVALDANILGFAKEWGKGIVLAVNKIDLIEGSKENYIATMLYKLQGELNFVPWLPVVFISAQDEENINFLLNQVIQADKNRRARFSDEELASVFELAKNSNPQLAGLTKLHQKKTLPPTFEVKYSGKEKPHYTQIRYLENKIRDQYPLSGTPIYLDLTR